MTSLESLLELDGLQGKARLEISIEPLSTLFERDLNRAEVPTEHRECWDNVINTALDMVRSLFTRQSLSSNKRWKDTLHSLMKSAKALETLKLFLETLARRFEDPQVETQVVGDRFAEFAQWLFDHGDDKGWSANASAIDSLMHAIAILPQEISQIPDETRAELQQAAEGGHVPRSRSAYGQTGWFR